MGCRRAFDLDLVACLLDTARPEWTEFREHYPRCADCAAEVRTWTELQTSLTPPHPAPDDLARYDDDTAGLRPETRRAIATHLTSCRSCQDELRALRAFDPRMLPAAPVAAPAVAPGAPRPRRGWPSLRRLVLHPAVAYGIALALAYPALAPRVRPYVVDRLERYRPQPAPRSSSPKLINPREEDTRGRSLVDLPPSGSSTDTGAAAPAREIGNLALGDRGDESARQTPPTDSPPMPEAPGNGAAAEGRMAKAERMAAVEDDWPVVVLTPSREVALHMPEHGLVLRLAPPRSLPAVPAGLAWLRVRDAAGRRELREQQLGNPGSNAEIRVAAPWLAPGGYRVDLVLGDDNRPVVTARFRIEP